MSTTMVLGILATLVGVAMGLSPLLQVRAILVRRSSDDIAVSYLFVLLTGFVLWLAYGIALHNAALIISNTLAFSTYLVTILAVLRFRTAGTNGLDG